jgi:hypothetical protein
MQTVNKTLPEEFQKFQIFCDKWCLKTERERYLARAHAPYSELVELYDAMIPELSRIITYLNQFPLNSMPESAKNLMNLTFSLMEATHAVELWKQSDVPDAFAPERIDINLPGEIVL